MAVCTQPWRKLPNNPMERRKAAPEMCMDEWVMHPLSGTPPPGEWPFYVFQFSCSVVSDSLRPHRLQHGRLPCPSSTPGTCSNSGPSTWWRHPTISSSVVPFSSCLQSCPTSIRVFSNESVLHIKWPKYWSFSFSISPSNECSGPISFRIDWFDLVQSKGLSRVFSITTVQKHLHFLRNIIPPWRKTTI